MTSFAFRRTTLAGIARDVASQQLRGAVYGAGPASDRGRAQRPPDPPGTANANWNATFVAHCARAAGLILPPDAGAWAPVPFPTVRAWVAWATRPEHACYYLTGTTDFTPDVGDLVIFDDLLGQGPQDHLGVLVDQTDHAFVTAEGNVKDCTGIFVRRKDRHINGFILLPEADEVRHETLAVRRQRQAASEDRRRTGWLKASGTGGSAVHRNGR